MQLKALNVAGFNVFRLMRVQFRKCFVVHEDIGDDTLFQPLFLDEPDERFFQSAVV